jgi:hypothetical protein
MTALYPRVVLEQIERFVGELCVTMDGYIAERSQESPPSSPAAR